MPLIEEKGENPGATAIEQAKARYEAERQLQVYEKRLNSIFRQHGWRVQTQAIADARPVVQDMEDR